jgi:hypothetical protein
LCYGGTAPSCHPLCAINHTEMKRLFGFFLLGIIASCTQPEIKNSMADRQQETDSLQIVFDSLMQLDVVIPQDFDYSIFNQECIDAFNELARETNGEMKVVVSSNLVTQAILDILQNYAVDNSDIMIILDKTQSMEDDLDNIKKSLHQIIMKLMSYNNIRLAMATYGDKNVDGRDWYGYHNFENDYGATNSFIDKINNSTYQQLAVQWFIEDLCWKKVQ